MPRPGSPSPCKVRHSAHVGRLCVDQEIKGREMHSGLEFAGVLRAGRPDPPAQLATQNSYGLRSGLQDLNLLLIGT